MPALPLPITAFYAGLGGLWLVYLALSVVRLRRRHRISLGDDGRSDLAHAIRAHGNAAETLPLALILLGLAELADAPALLLHLAGLTLIVGRMAHAQFFLRKPRQMMLRVGGMVATVSVVTALALGLVAFGVGSMLA